MNTKYKYILGLTKIKNIIVFLKMYFLSLI
jgi:hypothetical protein